MQLLRDAYGIFGAAPVHFGALLRMLRDRHGISQAAVVAHLPETISQRRYSSFELDGRSPRFDELTTLYRALCQAGVRCTLQDRRLFLALAQQKFASKKTHKAPASEEEWERLRLDLAQIDHLPDEASLRRQAVVAQNTPLPRRETGHLLGREGWLNRLFGAIQQPSVMKVIIVQGPPCSGKTSALIHRTGSPWAGGRTGAAARRHPGSRWIAVCLPADYQSAGACEVRPGVPCQGRSASAHSPG